MRAISFIGALVRAYTAVAAAAATAAENSASASSTSPNIAVTAEADSECIAQRDGGLCTVDVRKHVFRAPNPLLPEDIRGVYWIDAGNMTGKSNPWVDLNFLRKLPSRSSSSWFGRAAASADDELLYVMDGGYGGG